MQGLRSLMSWVLALFLVAMFLWVADSTLFGGEDGGQAVFKALKNNSDVQLFEPTGRLVVGVAEVLAALLILLPWTRRIGAVLGVLIGLGAVAMSAQLVMQGIPITLSAGRTADANTLLYLAVALLAVSLFLVFVHPGKAKDAGGDYFSRH
jgi:hypothetical protein